MIIPALFRDHRANTLVEFAMVLPVLLVLICGTTDLGYVYMAQTSLTGAVAQAARESSATQEQTQAGRDAAMRNSITQAMSVYKPVPGGDVQISTEVYADYTNAGPEPFVDQNGNGIYDPPNGTFPGEPFTDRNGNGHWDSSTPISDGGVGTEGQVVSYTATYRVAHLFGFLGWGGNGVSLTATSVTRNEPVKTQ